MTNAASNCATAIPFDAGSLTTFDWANMLAFPALPDFTYDFYFDMFAPRPALSPQAVSNTIFVVSEQVIASPTESNVLYMRITGTNAGGGTVLSAPLDLTDVGIVASFVDPPDPEDPGGILVDAVDRRPTDAIWQNNVLTFASTYPCVAPIGSGRDCARVTQLNTTPSTPTLVQDMLIGTTGADTWYPGIGQSQSGILHVVYTRSSATEGMSSFDRYQLPSDAINEMSSAREIANGGAVDYLGTDWGHYVGVAQDPRDTNAVWQGNQYARSGGTWGTRVSELQTPGSTFVGIAPVRLLDSRFNIGTTGPFTSSVPEERRHRRPRRDSERRCGHHRQPDDRRPAAGGLRLADAAPRRRPSDIHDQLPARRQPGQQPHEPAEQRRRRQPHLQGLAGQADPLHPRRDRLLPER